MGNIDYLFDDNTKSLKYNPDYSVAQANELVRSKQDDLTLLEAKLIRLAISQILKDDTDLKTYECSVIDLANYLNVETEYIYTEIQKVAKTLMSKSIFIKDNTNQTNGKYNYKIFHWIDYFEYYNGTITIKLSDNLKPYLIGLDKFFTLYGLSSVIALPTNYSIRFYELMMSFYNYKSNITDYKGIKLYKGEFLLSIDYLREYFNCNDKYPNTSDFIKRVIESSISYVELKSLVNISFRPITKGRKIIALVFKIHHTQDK